MNKIIVMLAAILVSLGSFSVWASGPNYLKCSGSIATTSLFLDESEKSHTEDHGNEVIGMTIDSNKIRLSGGDKVFSLLLPKTEFAICKANEVIEFYATNDQSCKLEGQTNSSPVDFYSGQYNRILDVLTIYRKREYFTDSGIKGINKKTKTISTGGNFIVRR